MEVTFREPYRASELYVTWKGDKQGEVTLCYPHKWVYVTH